LALGQVLCLAGAGALAAPEPGEGGLVLAAQDAAANLVAQANDEQSQEDQAEAVPNVFVPADRSKLRLLAKARQLSDQDRHAEAVRCLGAILESPEDYFFIPDTAPRTPRSLKQEAQRLLGQMSARGRELYELQCGARARRMLAEAAAAGDATALAEVSRRFFHTRAGYEATLLLGLHQLDRGCPLAGAFLLKRLRDASPVADQFEPALSLATATCWVRAGHPEKARQVLAALKNRDPGASVEIAGNQVPLFAEEADSLAWLAGKVGWQATAGLEQTEQWLMFRGNVMRNASMTGSGPLLNMRWRVPTSDHPYVEALIEEVRQANQVQARLALPSLHPLVVDHVVFMRTARNLLAVDFATGKRLWEAPVDDPYQALLQPPPGLPFQRTPQLELALRLRMWGDGTYGTLSSDGQSLFAVEDLGLEIGPARIQQVFIAGRLQTNPAGPKPYNRLAAYDVHTGKLKWHVGGSPDDFELPQAGAFFLGPPLPLMGQLFVLAEFEGVIRVMALDARTGSLLWSQQLASVDREILAAPLRRLAGVSPSYSDGILVCPTSNNSIVALELATRSLLWGYSYRPQDGRSQRHPMFFGVQSMLNPDPNGRWIDSSVVLGDGRVLVTPVESNDLHCLNLIDGKLLWKEPREDDLYLACVHQGKAILVGRQKVRAVDLNGTRDDPQQEQAKAPRPAAAWSDRTVALPEGSTPSGLGFLSDDLYYVPLSSAQVMAVDLNTGRQAHMSKARSGNVPGNLVCYKDMIISQRAGGVESFYQLKALQEQVDRRLAVNQDDAEALALRGEILWDEGQLQEAIGSLRRSLQLEPDPNTRELLRDALFEGLRTQFATQRRDLEEIRRLIDEPPQEAAYLRLMAVGLAAAGEFPSAMEYYVKLIELDHDRGEMEPVSKALEVRRDRWIQAQLTALRESGGAEMQAEIDRVAETRLKAALDEGTPEAVERYLDYFGGHPLAGRAQDESVRRQIESGQLLRAELLLRRQERADDPQCAGSAVARLATMLREAGRWDDAGLCYARLNQEFAEVACLDGKTGRDLVNDLPADDPVRSRFEPVAPWPSGKVELATATVKKSPPSTYTRSILQYVGSRGPFFANFAVEMHQSPPMIVGRDHLGNRHWELSLAEVARQGPFSVNRGLARVAAQGHLLLVSIGQRILAIDTLGVSENGTPRVLWQQDLDFLGKQTAGGRGTAIQVANVGGVLRAIQLARPGNVPITVPMAISEQLVCFKRFHHCVAIDPSTGEIVWVRQDIRPESSVFGDHEYVFVVPPGETKAMVLRAVDGKLLGRREVPPQRLATFGRHVLVWRNTGTEAILELTDPWDDRKVWPSREFAASAVLAMVGHEAVAVYEREGRFVLIDLPEGRTIIDAKLEPEPAVSQIFVLPSSDHYVLITHRSVPIANVKRRVYPMHGLSSVRITKGNMYAFDHQGKALWPSPVAVENQYLPLNQPSGLPVVTFTCMVHEQQPNGRTQSKTAVLCIDKRNGRVCLDEEIPTPTNSFRLVGDPEKKTVEVQLQRNTFTMTFTDKPLPPEPGPEDASEPKPAEAEEGSKTTGAIWKALQKAVVDTSWQAPDVTDRQLPTAKRPQSPPTQEDGDVPPVVQSPAVPIARPAKIE